MDSDTKTWQPVLSDAEIGSFIWNLLISAVALAGGLPVLLQRHEKLLAFLPLWQFIVLLKTVALLVWVLNIIRGYFACVAIAPSNVYYGRQYKCTRVP